MQPFMHDQYAALSHIPDFGDGYTDPLLGASSWVPTHDRRRLASYRYMAALRDNAGRYYLPQKMWQTDDTGTRPAEKYREYGDPALLVDSARSLLLGDTQTLVVPGAEPLPHDAPADERAAQATAVEFADALDEWAELEQMFLRLHEGEENTIGDGDALYALGWDTTNTRPRLTVYDPGFYFPDLAADGTVKPFPDVVHVAWEWTDPQDRIWVHRITWRLVDTGPTKYPWQGPKDPASTRTVLFSEGDWELTTLRKETVYNLPEDRAQWVTVDGQLQRDVDLQIDFLPVVHVPNDPAGARHFGRPLLLRLTMLLRDLAFAETDLASNSELVGSAPTKVKAGDGRDLPAGPGAQWNLPPGADAEFLDTSRTLVALLSYTEHLSERVAKNARLSRSLLGDISPRDVPSGYALELGFAPTRSLIREMRMVRDGKYPLICKFALRMMQAYKVLPAAPTPRVIVALGPYLPADKAAAVDRVAKLLPVHGISTYSAVAELVQAGFAIDDAEREVERIRQEWTAALNELFAATGSEAAVQAFARNEPLPDIPQPIVPAPAPGGGVGG